MILAAHETKETLLSKSCIPPFWIETDITELLFQDAKMEMNIAEYQLIDKAIRQYAKGYISRNDLMFTVSEHFCNALLRVSKTRNNMEIGLFWALELGTKLSEFVNARLTQ